MLIVGAGGLAKEIIEIVIEKQNEVYLFDDINKDNISLYGKYPILKNELSINELFKKDNKFCIGVGNPRNRKFLYNKFKLLGGELTSTISKYAIIGSHDVNIRRGCNIFPGAKLSNSVSIGKGALIYYNSIITHDVIIEDFVEISPGAKLLGKCFIKEGAQIGAGAIILPKIVIGKNSIVGAGAVVTKDVPDNTIVKGVPAK